MENQIIGQAFGIIAPIFTFLSYQTNKKKLLLFEQIIATLCTCISYFFLGAYSGFALNIVAFVRNIVFAFQNKQSKFAYVSTGIFVIGMVVLGALSWQGIVSLLVIIALAGNTICLSFGSPQTLRKSILCTSSLVLIYNCFVFSIGGIINEGIAIVSSAIGIIRFYKSNKEKENENTEKDMV